MKYLKEMLSVLMLVLSFSVMAQDAETTETTEKTRKWQNNESKVYNRSFSRWSIEANGGFNGLLSATTKNIVSGGLNGNYSTSRISPFHIDLGARFMINRIFGIKANVGYDKIEPGWKGVLPHKRRDISSVKPFEGHYYGFDIQGVVNLGQLFKFPEFTNRLGLLMHVGAGYRTFRLNKDIAPETYVDGIKRDNVATGVWGITPMIRLHDRLVLTMDFSQVYIGKQQTNLDGSRGGHGAIDGLLHNYTIGLTYNIGKKKHIDWAEKDRVEDKVDKLASKVDEEVKKNEDRDAEIKKLKDRTADLEESIADLDKNKLATDAELDKLRDELNKSIADQLSNLKGSERNDAIEDLSNRSLLAAYFDFDVRTPKQSSMKNIDDLASYLKDNPTHGVKLTGYADGIGDDSYNQQLSKDRANNVKKILVNKYGIQSSRIVTSHYGAEGDAGASEAIRSEIRRVTFDIIK